MKWSMPLFSRETVTLDFEGSTLRWLTVRGDQIRRWNRVRLTSPPTPQGRVDPGLLGSELADVFKAESLPKSHVVASISAQRTIFRTLKLPNLDSTLLDAAVQRKLRQEVPLQPQETDLSWEVVDRSDDELKIYVVAIPRDEIDHQVAVLRAAEIQPMAMDVKPLAVIRAVNRELALVVNLEDMALSIAVVVDGVPQIIRTVPLASSSPTAEGRLDLVGQELLRTTKFYNESHKRHPLPADCPLFLTGSGFQTKAMEERMAARTPYPVADLDPPLVCPPGLSKSEFGINLGLALKAL
jgi:type IV pilus assembly protein PilM